jgi:dolichyl-phosphate-mannose--protein O-mannosyl transferase
VVLTLGGVVVAVYLASYIPYLRLGHSFDDLLSLQGSMYDYHANLTAGHPYSSAWYEWPFGRKAVFFFASSRDASLLQIWTMANPVVLIGGLLGLCAMAIRARRAGDTSLALVPAVAVLQFAPYVLISRALFLYHYLPVVPLLAIALGWWVAGRRERVSVAPAVVGTVAVAAGFFALLPMLDGWWVSQSYLDTVRSWLSWYF